MSDNGYLLEIIEVQCVSGKWFGSAVCVQRDKNTAYIVSQSADQNHFRAVGNLWFLFTTSYFNFGGSFDLS